MKNENNDDFSGDFNFMGFSLLFIPVAMLWLLVTWPIKAVYSKVAGK